VLKALGRIGNKVDDAKSWCKNQIHGGEFIRNENYVTIYVISDDQAGHQSKYDAIKVSPTQFAVLQTGSKIQENDLIWDGNNHYQVEKVSPRQCWPIIENGQTKTSLTVTMIEIRSL